VRTDPYDHHLFAHELFGSRVGHRAHGHVGSGKSANFADIARYAEVNQQDPLIFIVIEMGDHDVGGFDIAMQQALLVRAIERTSHGGDNAHHVVGVHTCGVASAE
jgi:hypothetical protein